MIIGLGTVGIHGYEWILSASVLNVVKPGCLIAIDCHTFHKEAVTHITQQGPRFQTWFHIDKDCDVMSLFFHALIALISMTVYLIRHWSSGVGKAESYGDWLKEF